MTLVTQIEMHLESSLAWEEFAQHMLRCILCFCRHGLANTCWDSFCLLSGMWWILSAHIDFACSLAWVGFGQQKL